MYKMLMTFAACAAFALAGCNSSDEKPEAVQGVTLTAQLPASKCDSPKPATLAWDATAYGSGNVAVFVLADGKEQVFVPSAGPKGSIDMPSWAVEGTTFILKDASSSKELTRVVVGAPSC